jgi:hypothetical protein
MITSCKLPSKTGEIADIALGFDNIQGMIRNSRHDFANRKVK